MQVGIYSSLHYGISFLLNFPMSWLADSMVNSGRFSTVFVRKVFNSFGTFGPAAGLLVLAFAECNTALAVAGMTLGLCMNVGIFQGFKVNLLRDLFDS